MVCASFVVIDVTTVVKMFPTFVEGIFYRVILSRWERFLHLSHRTQVYMFCSVWDVLFTALCKVD